MSRYSTKDRYQVGDNWLSQKSNSSAWNRTWFDPETKQTRRASLRTNDFEEAKIKLNEWFILNHTKTAPEPTKSVTLASIFARFYEEHGQHLKSFDDNRRALQYWLDFHKEATVSHALTPHRQSQFQSFLLNEKKLSAGSTRRILAVGKSALNWSWKRGEIENLPYIALVKCPRPEPKGRPLELAEVVQLFRNAKDQHLKVFMAFMLGTSARTSAILDLQLNQIDLQAGLIELNPSGRSQTKKYRPVVKLPLQLRKYVQEMSKADIGKNVVCYRGMSAASIRSCWRSTRKRANLSGNVQTYSFRHTMARWLRSQSVPAWEVAAQLGHKAPEYSTTEIYAPFDPAYLKGSCEAIDSFLEQLAKALGADSMSEYLLNSN